MQNSRLEGLGSQVKCWLDAILGFLYPNVCQLCQAERATRIDGFVGEACQKRGVRWIREPVCDRCGLPYPGGTTEPFECSNCRDLDLRFDRARAAVVATPMILDVIHRYKYNNANWFEPFLARLLVQASQATFAQETFDWIVPVPLHPLKHRERGFNQASRLGQALSTAAGVPLNEHLVRRVEATRTQTLLHRGERVANMAHAFAAIPSIPLAGTRLLLVDDVLTTGSTTSACASALKDAGAESVVVWTLARGV